MFDMASNTVPSEVEIALEKPEDNVNSELDIASVITVSEDVISPVRLAVMKDSELKIAPVIVDSEVERAPVITDSVDEIDAFKVDSEFEIALIMFPSVSEMAILTTDSEVATALSMSD